MKKKTFLLLLFLPLNMFCEIMYSESEVSKLSDDLINQENPEINPISVWDLIKTPENIPISKSIYELPEYQRLLNL